MEARLSGPRVTPRFIPLREPRRNGVVEHFNDVWDRSFLRTEVFTRLHHLSSENDAFFAFHNTNHRYAAPQRGAPKRSTDCHDPDTAAALPDLPRIVAFRNVLVHGYAAIDDEIVWEVASRRVQPLIESITTILPDG